jgi:hypothetical protein
MLHKPGCVQYAPVIPPKWGVCGRPPREISGDAGGLTAAKDDLLRSPAFDTTPLWQADGVAGWKVLALLRPGQAVVAAFFSYAAEDGRTFCFWLPRPSMPSVMTSPPLRKRGGLKPRPTPGGVPVVMTSPGSRRMNWLI